MGDSKIVHFMIKTRRMMLISLFMTISIIVAVAGALRIEVDTSTNGVLNPIFISVASILVLVWVLSTLRSFFCIRYLVAFRPKKTALVYRTLCGTKRLKDFFHITWLVVNLSLIHI